MRTPSSLIPPLLLAALLAACSEQAPVTIAGPAARLGVAAAPSEYLVISASNSLPSGIEDRVQALGATVERSIPQIGGLVVTSDDPDFRSRASRLPGVRSVVPNAVLTWVAESQSFDATSLTDSTDAPDTSAVADTADAPDSVAATGAADPATSVASMQMLSARDALVAPAVLPTDHYFPLQWSLRAVQAPQAWAAGYLGDGARVAILDAGMDYTHPDLAPNYDAANSASLVPGEPIMPARGANHGTHVAGIIAAAMNNVTPAYSGGVVGVAPRATISAIKVLSSATNTGLFSWFAEGVVYAADHGAQVINASIGADVVRRGFTDANGNRVSASEVSELINFVGRATSYAHDRGVVIIVPAGNSAIDRNHDADHYVLPADLPHVVSVAATAPHGWGQDQSVSLDDHASYSNYGKSRIDLAAPGGDSLPALWPSNPRERPICIRSELKPAYANYCYFLDFVVSDGTNKSIAFMAGTSMAAPVVSGIAALIISKSNGLFTPDAVESKLRQSADDLGKPGRDDFYGMGRVNAYRAVQ